MKNSNEAHAALSAPSGNGETDMKQRAHRRAHLSRECPAPLVLHSRTSSCRICRSCKQAFGYCSLWRIFHSDNIFSHFCLMLLKCSAYDDTQGNILNNVAAQPHNQFCVFWSHDHGLHAWKLFTISMHVSKSMKPQEHCQCNLKKGSFIQWNLVWDICKDWPPYLFRDWWVTHTNIWVCEAFEWNTLTHSHP